MKREGYRPTEAKGPDVKKIPPNDVLEAAIKDTIGPEAYATMVDAKNSEITTLLLGVYAERVSRLEASDVLKQARENRFAQRSGIDQRKFLEFDLAFFSGVDDGVDVVELSPVAPLGSNAVLAGLSQNNVLSANRNVEIIADAVTSLAIECAQKRKKTQTESPIFFCTSHREVRAQQFDPSTGFLPHFRGVSLVSSHEFTGEEHVVETMMAKHLDFYLGGIKCLIDDRGYRCKQLKVAFSSLRILNALIKRHDMDMGGIRKNTQNADFDLFGEYGISIPSEVSMFDPIDQDLVATYGVGKMTETLQRISRNICSDLQRKYPEVEFVLDLNRTAGVGYYTDLCFKISATNQEGQSYPLADCGETDWTKQLLGKKNERCIAGGIGADLFISNFQKTYESS